jgi:hypothetical protein
MALRDLGAFLEDDGLEYPLPAASFRTKPGEEPRFPDGKTYKVPSPDARTGLWLTGLADTAMAALRGGAMTAGERERLKLDDDEEKSLYQRVLGPVYDEMIADGVSWTALQKVGQDAYLTFAMSEQIADAALAGQGEAKARPNRATRRAAKKTAGRKSAPASGAATRTPSPAATGSSTSPRGPEEQAKAV